MVKRKFISILMGVMLIYLLVGCTTSDHSSLNQIEKNAMDYLNSKNYTITDNLGNTEEYILDREIINKNPYSIIWGVQHISPEVLFNKTITTYTFIVENHPLEKIAHIMNVDASVQVNVFLSEGNVIGGTSYLNPKDNTVLFGGVYSIDGKDLEEMTGLSYIEWLTYWKKKYE